MFAIFRKRAGKLSADLEKLQKEADAIVGRAAIHIYDARQLVGILYREMDEAQEVIDTIHYGPLGR